MTDKVVKLAVSNEISADAVLESMKGRDYETVVVIAQRRDGGVDIQSNEGIGAVFVLVEMAKHKLILAEAP